MKSSLALLALLLTGIGATVLHAAPTAEQVIAQARARVGADARLKAVRTVTFEGKSYDANDKEDAYIEIQCKLPNKRREYALRGDRTVEVINATNGLEGYFKTVNIATQQGSVRPIEGAQIKTSIDVLHADTGFYSVPPQGKVTYLGEGKQQGKLCHILEYQYAGGLLFKRYFDKESAALVAYEIYGANTPPDKRRLVVEEGEILADGIRFPAKSILFDGDKKIATIKYTAVKVNPDIADSVFAFPVP
ncbi:MAG: hypothetical protein LBV28_02545 [Puniceicoccales bacterium]|nr:hypothetical protein [Puniceicoccales bacterium]